MENKRKKLLTVIFCCVFVFIVIIAPFLSVFLTGILLPAQYSQTYYGELAPMYARLKNTQGKKIIILGNSNVAFGVDSALAERLLKEAGEDYSVCNFGLYGALGTKMMCELAENCIKKDDIVIFTPELNAQSLSTYFSAEEAWYALDSDMAMFGSLSNQSKSSLAGSYFSYTAKKLKLHNGGKPAEASGIYAKASFDDNCDLKNCERPNNIMPNGADMNNPVELDANAFSDDFVKYINDYAANVKNRGGRFCYSFAPMNAYSMAEKEIDEAEAFYDTVAKIFDFDVISKAEDYIMDGEWFYDSNFHLNESGMTVRTVKLVNDIKNFLGNTTKTDCVLPEKPVIPNPDIVGEGDNSCADMFEYRLDGSYYTIVGLTDAGKLATDLILPYQVDGVYIKAFLPLVFMENKTIKSVTVQENIHNISNACFIGCDRLEKIIFRHTEPAEISVGYELLAGVPGSCKIFVPSAALSKFENNYFWGKYAKQLQGY